MTNDMPDISWKRMIDEVEELSDVRPSVRKYMKEGWKALADAFGPDWCQTAWQQRHPWVGNFVNKAPWVKAYFARIGHQIKSLAAEPRFDGILERLKMPNDCYSSQAELNVAYKLERARIPFQIIEPSPGHKSTDFEVKVDNKEVAVEVTTLRQSETFRIQMDIFREISFALQNPTVRASGIIHRDLSRPHAANLVEQIKNGIQEALSKGEMVLLREADVAEFCIAPIHLKGQVAKWNSDRGLEEHVNLTAPGSWQSSGPRLHRTIQQKCRQIPDSLPGVVYVEGVPIYVMKKDDVMFDFKKAEIEEAVYENTNLLFTVLNKYGLGWGRGVSLKDSGLYLTKRVYYRVLEDTSMVVVNRYHSFPRLRHKKLIQAFLRWSA